LLDTPNKQADGFIAQEINKIFPFMKQLSTSWDENSGTEEPRDNNGNPIYYSLEYNRFIPYIVRAQQETLDLIEKQSAMIEKQESRINELEEKLLLR